MNPSINTLTNEDTTWKSNFIICQYFESTSICLFRNPLFLMHRKVYTTSMRLLIHSHTHIYTHTYTRSSPNYSPICKKGDSRHRGIRSTTGFLRDFSGSVQESGSGLRADEPRRRWRSVRRTESRRLVTSSRAFSFRFVWSEHRSAV